MRIPWFTVVLALLAPAGVLAQGTDGGIRFDIMPVGCEIHVRHGNGQVHVETYTGKKGRNHLTETFSAGKHLSSTTYDAKGRMVRKDWAGNMWETFKPFSCFATPGTCRYQYRNGDGANRKYLGQVVKRGKGYVSSGGFAGEPAFSDSTMTFGPFGDIATFREGTTTSRVIEYRNCNLGS